MQIELSGCVRLTDTTPPTEAPAYMHQLNHLLSAVDARCERKYLNFLQELRSLNAPAARNWSKRSLGVTQTKAWVAVGHVEWNRGNRHKLSHRDAVKLRAVRRGNRQTLDSSDFDVSG